MENLLNGFMLRLRLYSSPAARTIHQSSPEITAGKNINIKKIILFVGKGKHRRARWIRKKENKSSVLFSCFLIPFNCSPLFTHSLHSVNCLVSSQLFIVYIDAVWYSYQIVHSTKQFFQYNPLSYFARFSFVRGGEQELSVFY